jgi:hypothetical protein
LEKGSPQNVDLLVYISRIRTIEARSSRSSGWVEAGQPASKFSFINAIQRKRNDFITIRRFISFFRKNVPISFTLIYYGR